MAERYADIKDVELRAWNRCAAIFNIAKDDMKEAAKYAGSFVEAERDDISKMFERIKKDGYDTTRAAISRHAQSLPRDASDNSTTAG